MLIEIDDMDHLNQELANAAMTDQLVIAEFKFSYCTPCKIMAPKVKEFAENHPEVNTITDKWVNLI